MKKMKITMFGTRGAGKTCFMLAMYAKMSAGINGFTLNTQDPDLDLDLADDWDVILDGGWPPANDAKVINYSFNFNYALTNRLMEFDWIDYRGGAWTDRQKKTVKEGDIEDNAEIKEIKERFKASDCVFLCISGEHLVESIESGINRDLSQDIRRINSAIQDGFSGARKTIPIVILVTKSDLCNKRKQKDVFDDIKALFNSFFVPDGGWSVMICPVTLGGKLVDNINSGEIEPINVHLPLIFAIYFEYYQNTIELQNKRREYQAEQNKHQKAIDTKNSELGQVSKELDKLNERNPFAKGWDNLWGKDKTSEISEKKNKTDSSLEQEKDRLQSVKNQLDFLQGQSDDIQKKFNLLSKQLSNDNISVNIDGKEVELNV